MSNKNFFQELSERRFIRFTLSYLVAAWAILQFVDWLVNRYGLAPSWTDLFLFFFVAMLPGVLLYTWFHGRPGKDKVGLFGKMVLPGNFILAALIAVFLFSNKPFVTAAERVTVLDEEGEKIERMVPVRQFTSKLALFGLENKTGDEAEDWLTLAVPFLLGADLEQDDRLQASAAFELMDDMQDYNYNLGDNVPFSIKRKIASDILASYFTTGELGKEDGKYKAFIQFYETDTGKKIGDGNYVSDSPYDLVDQISVDFIDNIYLPDFKGKELRTVIDLPADNLYSPELPALKLYQEGRIAWGNNQLQAAIQAFQKATEDDPSFSPAFMEMGVAYYKMNAVEQGKAALEKAMSSMQGLPERQQFYIRYNYYYYTENYEKAIALLEMWQQLYPSNETPWVLAIKLYMARQDFGKAKEVGLEATRHGHEGRVLLLLAQLSSVQGKSEEAMGYYERFSEQFPERAQEAVGLGYLYQAVGAFEKSKIHFEKVLLLRPNDAEILMGIAKAEHQLGRFDEAWKYFETALTKSKNGEDSVGVILSMSYFKNAIGQGNQAIELIEKTEEINSRIQSPFAAQRIYLPYPHILFYKNMGRENEVLKKIEGFIKTFPDPSKVTSCAGYLNYYIATEEGEKLKQKMAECEEPLKPFIGTGQLKMAYGFMKKVDGDYKAASQLLEEYFTQTGLDASFAATLLGELNLLNDELDKAEEKLIAGLKIQPFSGETNYQLALLHEKKGDMRKAKEFLRQALVVWGNADENFAPANRAKELAKKWAM